MLLPRMLNDAFKLTVDVIFKTKKIEVGERDSSATPLEEQPYKVNGYSDSQNLWQHLCALGTTVRPSFQGPTTPPKFPPSITGHNQQFAQSSLRNASKF